MHDPTETLAAQATKSVQYRVKKFPASSYNLYFYQSICWRFVAFDGANKDSFPVCMFPSPIPAPETLLAGPGICYVISGKCYIRLTGEQTQWNTMKVYTQWMDSLSPGFSVRIDSFTLDTNKCAMETFYICFYLVIGSVYITSLLKAKGVPSCSLLQCSSQFSSKLWVRTSRHVPLTVST